MIPADRKWFARTAAACVIVEALMEIDPRYPKVSKEQRRALQAVKEHLEAQAPEGAAPDPNEKAAGAPGRDGHEAPASADGTEGGRRRRPPGDHGLGTNERFPAFRVSSSS